MSRASTPTVYDQFCGAGGSSIGAALLGLDVKVALNHWPLAIETHQTNFPHTYHEVADISMMDPRRFPPADILLTSPECTNMPGGAKGVSRQRQHADLWGNVPDPGAEKSRATMWDVPRWAEAHDYEIIIVENVIQVRQWRMWDSWIHAMMVSLGYAYEIVYFNSMFAHPTPQSRDRIYIVFYKPKNRKPDLSFTPTAWCPRCARDVASAQSWKRPERAWGVYKRQYLYCCPHCAQPVTPYYYAAANVIDWTLPIERIGDRKQPLKTKTRERIRAGLQKYARGPRFLVDAGGVWQTPASALTDPYPTQTIRRQPGLLLDVGGAWIHEPTTLLDPHPTQTANRHSAFVLAPGSGGRPWGIADHPLPAQIASAAPGLVVPWIIETGHGGPENASRVRAATDPLPTVHTVGGAGIALAPCLTHLSYDGEGEQVRGMIEAPPTQLTRQDGALVLAPFLVEMHSHNTARAATDPLHTVVAGGNVHGVACAPVPFLMTYNGQTGYHRLEEPVPTQTALDRHALVGPRSERAETQERGRAHGSITVEDIDACYFRVLKPHEIQAAMAFPATYVVKGTQRDKIRQLGNAVTPPVMEMLLRRCIESLG